MQLTKEQQIKMDALEGRVTQICDVLAGNNFRDCLDALSMTMATILADCEEHSDRLAMEYASKTIEAVKLLRVAKKPELKQ